MSKYRLSVVVCTYNREDLLPKCLVSLCQQTLSSSLYEIIIVDNASTDQTPQIIQSFQEKFPTHNIVYVYEATQGLGHARNTGWRAAQGLYIAYIDDDAIAPSHWLEKAWEVITVAQPAPICIGGPIGVFYTVAKPEWFKDEYEIRSFGEQRRLLHQGESFSGSNMIWDITYLQKYNGFDTDKGVQGEFLSVGEEFGLFKRIWANLPSANLIYDPYLQVQHFVAPIKLSLTYRWRRAFVTGQVFGKEAILNYKWPKLVRCKIATKELWVLIKLMYTAWGVRSKYKYWQSWVVEEGETLFIKVGYLLSLLGANIKFHRN